MENDGHEDKPIQPGTDHRVPEASRSRDADQGAMPQGRLKELESENAKLKKLLAEAHLDIHALKGCSG
jgi:putative transposase